MCVFRRESLGWVINPMVWIFSFMKRTAVATPTVVYRRIKRAILSEVRVCLLRCDGFKASFVLRGLVSRVELPSPSGYR
jgi:hypothetical protein